MTDAVRKAYILQYAPVGAETVQVEPDGDAAPVRALADDPERQFPVLLGGAPVESRDHTPSSVPRLDA